MRTLTLDDFFRGYPNSRLIFSALRQAFDTIKPVSMTISKSQIVFRRRKAFAWAWVPDKYLRGRHAPLVLSLALRYQDPSPRWKQVVRPAPSTFMHHLELLSSQDLDDEVIRWIWEAWAEAG